MIWWECFFFLLGMLMGYTWDINTNIILWYINLYKSIYHILSSYHTNMIYGMGRRMDLPSHRPPMPEMPGVETGAAAAGDEAQRHWWHEWVWWWRWCGCCSCCCWWWWWCCSCCWWWSIFSTLHYKQRWCFVCWTMIKDDWGDSVMMSAWKPGVCPWKSHQRCLARPGKPRQISVVWMKCSRNCTNIRSSHLLNYETNC